MNTFPDQPVSINVTWRGHGHSWPRTSGIAWKGDLDVKFADTEMPFHAEVTAARCTFTRQWLAQVTLQGGTAETRRALHAELRTLGLLLGERGDHLDSSWVAGRGKTRDEAAKQAALASWFCRSRLNGKNPHAVIAGSRARLAASIQRNEGARAKERAIAADRQMAAARASIGERALAELLRMDAEGLLDGSNPLAGLKSIVADLRGLQVVPGGPVVDAAWTGFAP